MSLSPETPQDHDYCRIPDHDESTEKKVELGKRKSDEKTNENFMNDTGKSFSVALILASTNPQCDKRLFIELQAQYMKIPRSEHVVYINCSECQNKKQFVYTTCSQHVLSLEFSCTELVIQ